MNNGNGHNSALALLDRSRDRLLAAIPRQIGPDRFFAIAVSVAKNPKLSKCRAESILMGIFTCAKLGLTPDDGLGLVYLIPQGGDLQVRVSYAGFIELARNTGKIGTINTEIVYAGEEFNYWIDNSGKNIRHVPDLDLDRETAEKRQVYCIAEVTGWKCPQIEIMTASQVARVRKAAQTDNVWKNWEGEMWRKSVIRRASKAWPKSAELSRAFQLETQADAGEKQQLDQFETPAVTTVVAKPNRVSSLMDDDAPGDAAPVDSLAAESAEAPEGVQEQPDAPAAQETPREPLMRRGGAEAGQILNPSPAATAPAPSGNPDDVFWRQAEALARETHLDIERFDRGMAGAKKLATRDKKTKLLTDSAKQNILMAIKEQAGYFEEKREPAMS